MRCFVAIECSEEVRDECRRIQEVLKFKGLKKSKDFHITLKFIGDVDEDKVGDVTALLDKVRVGKFSITTYGVGAFPDVNNPRVVWVGLKAKEIFDLQGEIEEKLSGLFSRDDRFHPHITLDRVKFLDDKRRFLETIDKIEVKEMEFHVSSFVLFKSTLTPNGPVYEKLKEFELKA